MRSIFVILTFVTFTLFSCGSDSYEEKFPLEVEQKLESMSLEEKIGQMTMICLSEVTVGRDKKLILDERRLKELISNYHIGAFLSATGSSNEWKSFTRKVQTINMETSGAKIPLLIGIDHVHGANYVNEGTFFPHNLMLACSFDTSLIANIAKVTAKETAGLGVLWNFAPVLDLGKNPLWPRLYETYGEDPYLCSKLGESYIRNYENYRTTSEHFSAGCLKHFVGYSDPRAGHDRSPAEIPDQIMYEMFIPPFEAAVKAGARSIMVNSGEVNGVPLHISSKYLKEILREQMGFKGVIVTDIKDILKLVEMHKTVPTLEEAVVLAVNAGIDMSMSCNYTNFCDILREKVNEGVIPESRIDESVKRILTMKYELGLFKNPFPEDDFNFEDTEELHSHHELAYEAAVSSQVLLKNDGILPLDLNSDIVVTGFSANSKRNLNGPWTLEWLGAEEERQPEKMNSIYDAMKQRWKGEIKYIDPGVPEFDHQLSKVSQGADAIIVTIGETPYSEFKGNISDLTMPESCMKNVEIALSTGKPVILVLVQGRPRLLEGMNEKADAILFTGFPGMMGADALCDIISGKRNPLGKLAFTYPENPANMGPYNSKNTRIYEPLYPFGYGLSYTGYKYSDLQLSDTLIGPGETLTVSVSIENTGSREGQETVLLYYSDLYGKITRPEKELVRFSKVPIQPGEIKTIEFKVFPEQDLSYPDEAGNIILESGKFKILCGDLEKEFNIQYE